MRAVLTTIAVMVAMVVVGTAPATAGGYAGNDPDGRVLNSTVVAGDDVVFVADCFAAGGAVTVAVDGPGDADLTVNGATEGTDTATGTADGDGAVRAVITAEATGTYTVTATGQRTCASGAADATFTVVTGGAASDLPRTGASALATQVGIGAGLVALGAVVVLLVSRRRSSSIATA